MIAESRREGITRVEILAFDRRFDRSSFSCGKPDLDDWLKTQAGQQERVNNTRTFLAVDGVEGDRVLRHDGLPARS